MILFPESKWATQGAYFWDSNLGNNRNWNNLPYTWIASSNFGDQVVWIDKTSVHQNGGIYMCGPNIAGPVGIPDWPECILYLGESVDDWLDRLDHYGDEYSVGPASIRDELADSEHYISIYKKLNPGIQW